MLQQKGGTICCGSKCVLFCVAFGAIMGTPHSNHHPFSSTSKSLKKCWELKLEKRKNNRTNKKNRIFHLVFHWKTGPFQSSKWSTGPTSWNSDFKYSYGKWPKWERLFEVRWTRFIYWKCTIKLINTCDMRTWIYQSYLKEIMRGDEES